MSLFDKKEEVLNTELTQYGKKMLSMGDFNPVYYAFYDEDIIYDSTYAQFSESHLDTKERIKDGLSFKPLYTFTTKQNEDKLSLENELGNSSLINTTLPAWNIKVLNNEFTNCCTVPPSASMTITYSSRTKTSKEYNDYTDSEFHSKTNIYDDKSYLEITRNYVLLDIQEINGYEVLGEDIFEIEFFVEENGVETKLTSTEIIDYLDIVTDNKIQSQIICEKITDKGNAYTKILPRCNNYNGDLILGRDSISENIYDFDPERGVIC